MTSIATSGKKESLYQPKAHFVGLLAPTMTRFASKSRYTRMKTGRTLPFTSALVGHSRLAKVSELNTSDTTQPIEVPRFGNGCGPSGPGDG